MYAGFLASGSAQGLQLVPVVVAREALHLGRAAKPAHPLANGLGVASVLAAATVTRAASATCVTMTSITSRGRLVSRSGGSVATVAGSMRRRCPGGGSASIMPVGATARASTHSAVSTGGARTRA